MLCDVDFTESNLEADQNGAIKGKLKFVVEKVGSNRFNMLFVKPNDIKPFG